MAGILLCHFPADTCFGIIESRVHADAPTATPVTKATAFDKHVQWFTPPQDTISGTRCGLL
jgi:hypothetical protein